MVKKFLIIILLAFVIFFSFGMILYGDFNVLEKTKEVKYSEGTKNEFIIYLINMERSKDRLEFVMPMIKQLGLEVEIISAIDGKLISNEFFEQNTDKKSFIYTIGTIPKKSELGCYLSHLKAYETFLKSDYKYALILEDDVVMSPIDLKKILNALPNHKDKWDIFQIDRTGWDGMPKKVVKLTDHFKLAYYLTEVSRASAYAINKHAAAKLLEHAFPMKLVIDRFFTRGWEMDFKFAGLELNPGIAYYGDSSISNKPHIIKKDLNHCFFRIKSAMIRFIHNLKLYLSTKYDLSQ